MREEHHRRIGTLIAQLREQQGWSQRALAKWVGIDQSAVSRIEAGRRRLSADELQRFADALHISADELLRGAAETATLALSPAMPSPADDKSLDEPITARSDLVRSSSSVVLGSDLPATTAPLNGDLQTGLEAEYDAQAQRPLMHLQREAFEPAMRLSRTGSLPLSREEDDLERATTKRPGSGSRGLPHLAGLPGEVAGVARDWFALRDLADAPEPAQRWSTGHSAEGKPERVQHTASSLRPGAPAGDVLYDRVARFWRSELHVDPDDGPLPDIVPLLEDGYGAQIVVARVGTAADRPALDRPVAAAFTVTGVPFIFVNAARPVVLQRFALAHAFAHRVLGHGDVIDARVEWSRNIPPEAAANDFAEELLAPVRAVQRWYDHRPSSRSTSFEDLLDLGNAFGISAWAALYRSRAAGRLHGKQFHTSRGSCSGTSGRCCRVRPTWVVSATPSPTSRRTRPSRRGPMEGRPCFACRRPCAPGPSRRCGAAA